MSDFILSRTPLLIILMFFFIGRIIYSGRRLDNIYEDFDKKCKENPEYLEKCRKEAEEWRDKN